MPVLLSLLAAVAYGLSDFNGGIFSRKGGAWAVSLVAQAGGATLVLLLTLVTDGSPTSTDLAWSVVAGLGNGFGTAFLYRGLSSGRMGVVAPVSAIGSVLVPVVVGLATGELPEGTGMLPAGSRDTSQIAGSASTIPDHTIAAGRSPVARPTTTGTSTDPIADTGATTPIRPEDRPR